VRNATATRVLDGTLVILGIVAVWQVLHWISGAAALASPEATMRRMFVLMGDNVFWGHVAESIKALVLALLISSFGGLALGLSLGARLVYARIAEPILTALYSLPKVTLYPVILLIFGLGLSAKVAFGAIHGLIPVTIFAMNAVRNLNPVLLRTARVMRLSQWQAVTTVLMPAALPEVVTGLRVGFSLTLVGVLIGELFASQRGLGYMIISAIRLNEVETIMAVTVFLAVFAVGVNIVLLAIDQRLHRRS